MDRKANSLQVGSVFGKTRESVNIIAIVAAVWDELRRMYTKEWLSQTVKAAVAAMAPESVADLVVSWLQADWSKQRIVEELEQLKKDSEAWSYLQLCNNF